MLDLGNRRYAKRESEVTARMLASAARIGGHLDLPRIAFVGTFPPTQCGVASFSNSLLRSISQARPEIDPLVVRVVRSTDHARGPGQAEIDWRTDDPASLGEACDAIRECDVAIVQHEYGIYGGRDGEAVLDLIRATSGTLRVVVLHTVLAEPSPNQRAVLEAIVELADVTVTQSQEARSRLCNRYSVVDPDRIVRIPHGTWTIPSSGQSPFRPHWDAPVVLSWGLLGPGKGIEHGIAAMAKLAEMDCFQEKRSAPIYFVAGETHPKVRAAEGERYRENLREIALRLGIDDRVILDGRYHDNGKLAELIRRAEVVLLPYDSREQVTSGVLVEALAAGKPVVATRFPHACEALATGAGLLVDHGDVEAMAVALRAILTEPAMRAAMSAEAGRLSAEWRWSAVAARYLEVIDRLVADRRAA